MAYFNWYGPEHQKVQDSLGASPELVAAEPHTCKARVGRRTGITWAESRPLGALQVSIVGSVFKRGRHDLGIETSVGALNAAYLTTTE